MIIYKCINNFFALSNNTMTPINSYRILDSPINSKFQSIETNNLINKNKFLVEDDNSNRLKEINYLIEMKKKSNLSCISMESIIYEIGKNIPSFSNISLFNPSISINPYKYLLIEEIGNEFEISLSLPTELWNNPMRVESNLYFNDYIESDKYCLIYAENDVDDINFIANENVNKINTNKNIQQESNESRIKFFNSHISIRIKSTEKILDIVKELNKIIPDLKVRFHTSNMNWIPLDTSIISIKDMCPGMFLDINNYTFIIDYNNLKLSEANEMKRIKNYHKTIIFLQDCWLRYPWKRSIMIKIASIYLKLHNPKYTLSYISNYLKITKKTTPTKLEKIIKLIRTAYLELGIYNLFKVKKSPNYKHIKIEFPHLNIIDWQSLYQNNFVINYDNLDNQLDLEDLFKTNKFLLSQDNKLISIQNNNLKASLICLKEFLRLSIFSNLNKLKLYEIIIVHLFAIWKIALPICISCCKEISGNNSNNYIEGELKFPEPINENYIQNPILNAFKLYYEKLRSNFYEIDKIQIALSFCGNKECENNLKIVYTDPISNDKPVQQV